MRTTAYLEENGEALAVDAFLLKAKANREHPYPPPLLSANNPPPPTSTVNYQTHLPRKAVLKIFYFLIPKPLPYEEDKLDPNW